MKSLLPGAFQMDHIIFVHVRRDSLQNRETKILRVAVAKQPISAVAVGGIDLPSAVKVVLSVRRTDVAFPV